jgi:hypothetical protein
MSKRQEKPYAARIAAMSKPKLTAEIERLLHISVTTDSEDETHLRECIAEDEKRGGTCYPAAVEKLNASLGYRRTGPTSFDLRESHATT